MQPYCTHRKTNFKDFTCKLHNSGKQQLALSIKGWCLPQANNIQLCQWRVDASLRQTTFTFVNGFVDERLMPHSGKQHSALSMKGQCFTHASAFSFVNKGWCLALNNIQLCQFKVDTSLRQKQIQLCQHGWSLTQANTIQLCQWKVDASLMQITFSFVNGRLMLHSHKQHSALSVKDGCFTHTNNIQLCQWKVDVSLMQTTFSFVSERLMLNHSGKQH